MVIREFYDKGLFVFADSFPRWEDAIYASIQPMIDRGIVDRKYGDEIIDSVHKYGAYINISEEVCIPHAGISPAVHGSEMTMMITKKPVDFGEDSEFKPRLFFAFCSTDADAHLERLRQISDFCSDEESMEELLRLQNEEELKLYLRQKGERV